MSPGATRTTGTTGTTATGWAADGVARRSALRGEVVRELARARTPVDRLRLGATAVAAAGLGAAVLAAASVVGLAAPVSEVVVDDAGTSYLVGSTGGSTGLSPFVDQPGLRQGVVLALALLGLPFVALALQALRTGSLDLDRRAALLVVAGAGPADLRRVAARRSATAFALGGLLAAPVHAVSWVLLSALQPPMERLLPVPQWWLVVVWLALVPALAGVGALLGRRGADVRPDPVGWSRAPARVPPRSLVAGAGAVAAAVTTGTLLWLAAGGGGGTGPDWAVSALLFVVLLALAVCVAGAVARRAARPAGERERARRGRRRPVRRVRGDAAVGLLAAAQRRGDPLAAGTVAGVLVVAGGAVGVAAALAASVLGQGAPYDAAFYVGGAALAARVALAGGLVALLALALSLTDHLLVARRAVAATAALGTEPRRLVAVQARALRATAVPSLALGALVGGLLLGAPLAAGPGQLGAVLVGVVLAAVLVALLAALVCRLLAAALSGRVRAASSLEHLRTP
ncbi:hypothetical protein WDZ16_01600 [Pseudokineococcus marinus]|uniref:hypothetical protein n=1 Tax=Pseudokineococcus marinus TaxID=351215 RepID=UPI003097EB9C